MRTIADMKTAGMTLVEMLIAAGDEPLGASTLESLCLDAAAAISVRDYAIEHYREELEKWQQKTMTLSEQSS